jgi:hypothetical protein
MSKQFATVVRCCRECGTILYGPVGGTDEIWPHWIDLLQGKETTFKGEVFAPFHQCSNNAIGVLECVCNQYRYVAPFPDRNGSIVDPDVLAAMAPAKGDDLGYELDMANARLPGGGK